MTNVKCFDIYDGHGEKNEQLWKTIRNVAQYIGSIEHLLISRDYWDDYLSLVTAMAENGRTWMAELCGHVTRGPHKRTLLRPALLSFSFPFSSFRFLFIDNLIVQACATLLRCLYLN